MTQLSVRPFRFSPAVAVPRVPVRWAVFMVLSVVALGLYGLEIVPVLAALAVMLVWRTSWQQTHHPFARALAFLAVAFCGGIATLALSPGCASGAMLGLLMMNLAATALSRR